MGHLSFRLIRMSSSIIFRSLIDSAVWSINLKSSSILGISVPMALIKASDSCWAALNSDNGVFCMVSIRWLIASEPILVLSNWSCLLSTYSIRSILSVSVTSDKGDPFVCSLVSSGLTSCCSAWAMASNKQSPRLFVLSLINQCSFSRLFKVIVGASGVCVL